MHRWNGCVALVTGATRGIGAAISKKLVDNGVKVVGCAKDVQDMERNLVSSQGNFHFVKCDVSQENEVKAMFEDIRRKFDRLDICINNAGIIEHAPIMSGNSSDWKRIMEVNVLGMCLCTREALNLMREKKIDDGVIIQMGSIGGHKIASIPKGHPDPGFAIYNGTKFMVRALAESLRQELKSHDSRIRVSTISPGPVRTAMLEKAMSSEDAKSYLKSVRCLDPEDVAEAVGYILKNGAHVNVDDVIVQSLEFHV